MESSVLDTSGLYEYLDGDYGIPLYEKARKCLCNVDLVMDEWLVHGYSGDIGSDIIKNGFSNGLSRESLNSYSMNYGIGEHVDSGYSWAYKAEYFTDKLRVVDYGNSILFQASGIEYCNYHDCDRQVIFYNKSAINRILIYKYDGILYGVGCINGSPLYVGYFGDVIEWCIKNFEQYKEHLLSNTEIPNQ